MSRQPFPSLNREEKCERSFFSPFGFLRFSFLPLQSHSRHCWLDHDNVSFIRERERRKEGEFLRGITYSLSLSLSLSNQVLKTSSSRKSQRKKKKQERARPRLILGRTFAFDDNDKTESEIDEGSQNQKKKKPCDLALKKSQWKL